jgi:HD-GYP domain-containing protein (c-di-GMP phosphodiesterase class II)
MSKLRWPLRLYILAVIAAGAVALLAGAVATSSVRGDSLAVAAILVAFASVAKRWPMHLSAKMKLTAGDTASFAAALVLGPLLAMLVAGGSTALAQLLTRRGSWHNRAFNAAGHALGAGAAAVTYAALAEPDTSLLANPLAILAAAIVKYLVDSGLVDLAVGLQLRRNPILTWWPIHRRDLLPHAVLFLLAIPVALLVATHPWAVAVFAGPVAAVLLLMRESAGLREQTRTALHDLADLVDQRDPFTHGHQQRTAALAERLARRMRLQPSQVELIREAARVHDIGKIGTDDHVLLKPGPLDEREEADMRRHAEIGGKLLARLPEFWEGASLVVAHHERPDGKGYPRGLSGHELPLEAQVVAVADAYDAMTNDRPYRPALTGPATRAEFVRGRGSQWDHRVVDALVAMIDEESGAATAPVSAPRSRPVPEIGA